MMSPATECTRMSAPLLMCATAPVFQGLTSLVSWLTANTIYVDDHDEWCHAPLISPDATLASQRSKVTC